MSLTAFASHLQITDFLDCKSIVTDDDPYDELRLHPQ
jgi:hypothetical protein